MRIYGVFIHFTAFLWNGVGWSCVRLSLCEIQSRIWWEGEADAHIMRASGGNLIWSQDWWVWPLSEWLTPSRATSPWSCTHNHVRRESVPLLWAAFLVYAVEKQSQPSKPPEVAYKGEILRDGRSVKSGYISCPFCMFNGLITLIIWGTMDKNVWFQHE